MIQKSVDWFLYEVIKLDSSQKIVQSLNFFLYDSIKIILLLFVMISIMGFIRTYVSEDKIRKWLSGKRTGLANLVASLFGAVTPFCSCSSIPVFLSFVEAGVPLGVTFSFLITSPLVNEFLVVLMFSFFGWKITLAYVISGVLIGVFSGLILGGMKLEKYLEHDLMIKKAKEIRFKSLRERAVCGFVEAKLIVKKLWLWVLIGVGTGAVIHNYVPQQLILDIVSKGGFLTVPIATLLGVPMYGSCAAIVPIAVALFRKGVPLGTALAFMMAIAALSFPAALVLRRAMKLKLILIFFAIVTFGIIITGCMFNLIQWMLV